MGILSIVIKKVAEQASKVVLFGALVGGVSLSSYATETPGGPTIEKAQLETVDLNLDAVVAAITKADPDWVKGLPRLKAKQATVYYGVTGQDTLLGRLYITDSPLGSPNEGDCGSESYPCKISFEDGTVMIHPATGSSDQYVDIDSGYDESEARGPFEPDQN